MNSNRYAVTKVNRVWYVIDTTTGVRVSGGTYSRQQAVAQALGFERDHQTWGDTDQMIREAAEQENQQ